MSLVGLTLESRDARADRSRRIKITSQDEHTRLYLTEAVDTEGHPIPGRRRTRMTRTTITDRYKKAGS